MIEIRRKTQQAPQIPVKATELTYKGHNAKQAVEHLQAEQSPLKGQQMPFMSIDGKTDYKQVFADVYRFLQKYSPPEKDPDGMPGGYWWKVGLELSELAQRYGAGSLMHNMLIAVYQELEREYKILMDNSTDG